MPENQLNDKDKGKTMNNAVNSLYLLKNSSLFSPLYYNEENVLFWCQLEDVWLRFSKLGILYSITAKNLSGETKTFKMPEEVSEFNSWSWKKISSGKTAI